MKSLLVLIIASLAITSVACSDAVFILCRLLNSFVCTANIPVGRTWFLNDIVNFPSKWRPSSWKINLIITDDGSNTIVELGETNNISDNISDTIWNINLP